MKSKYIIRYVVVRFTPNHHIPVIMNEYAYKRADARWIMNALASVDFSNYAMYAIRRVKINVPKFFNSSDVLLTDPDKPNAFYTWLYDWTWADPAK